MAGCVTENEVVDLFEGRLDASATAQITGHIDACPDCRRLVAAAALTVVEESGDGDEPGEAPLGRGSVLGRYVILGPAGAGAMGLVYAAYDPDLGRRVALKILRADAAAYRGRLLREAQAMARLAHPNVITVHDVGTFGERVFLAMELVEGGTLAAWQRAKQRGWREVVAVYRQAGEGLAAAHAAGLVHRDFKPDNVLLGADGRVRVTDFGLVRSGGVDAIETTGGGDVEGGTLLSATLTRTGALVGTPAYMAPEQARGDEATPRSDLFGFCVALHEALYGVRPFAGEGLADLVRAIEANRAREAPRGSRVPAWLRRVVLRGLRAAPEERWPSMPALLAALGRGPLVSPGRAAALALVIALVPLGILGLRRPPAAAVCTGATQAWGSAWDAPAREAARAAFVAARGARGDRVLGVASARLDAYRDAWVGMHTEACEATRRRGDQSEAVLDLRMRCLAARRGEVAALARTFAGADPATVDHAVEAVGRLPAVHECARVGALSAVAPLPGDPALRAKIAELEGRAAEARALLLLGKYPAGLPIATAAEIEARPLGYLPLTARLLFLRGRMEEGTMAFEAAEATYHDAAIAAEQAQDDGAAADAWSWLVGDVGFRLRRPAEAARWARYAEAAIARLGGDDARELVRLQRIVSVKLYVEDRPEEALADLERQAAICARLPCTEDQLAGLDGARGSVLGAMERNEEARAMHERSYLAFERLFGLDHPSTGTALVNLGSDLISLGRFDEAIAAFRRIPPGPFTDGFLRRQLARALRGKGDFAAALGEDQGARAVIAARAGPPGDELVLALRGEGQDLVGLGRAREAIPSLERAAALAEGIEDPAPLAAVRFTLGTALWDGGGDRRRARALVEEARRAILPKATRLGGDHKVELDAMDAWLAGHPAP